MSAFRAVVVGSVLALAPFAGCSPTESKPLPVLYPVTGKLEREGTPVSAGGLIFSPAEPRFDGLTVNANVNPDGTFSLETSRSKSGGGVESRPGSPAGNYKAVYHPDTNGARMGLEYHFPDTITIGENPTVIDIKLPKDLPTGDGEPRDEVPAGSPPTSR